MDCFNNISLILWRQLQQKLYIKVLQTVVSIWTQCLFILYFIIYKFTRLVFVEIRRCIYTDFTFIPVITIIITQYTCYVFVRSPSLIVTNIPPTLDSDWFWLVNRKRDRAGNKLSVYENTKSVIFTLWLKPSTNRWLRKVFLGHRKRYVSFNFLFLILSR